MSSNKRVVIELSPDDEEDYALIHPCTGQGLHPKPQQTEQEQEAPSSVSAEVRAAFVNCLQTAIPIKLVPRDLAAYIQHESNARLEMAMKAGVGTEDIYIGDDCLPTWRGMAWDPEEQSLHSVIQGRLLDYEISRELGDFLRREIIVKGNRKLDKAREMGVKLGEMFFGESLLAAWPKVVEEEGDGHDVTASEMADDEMDDLDPPSWALPYLHVTNTAFDSDSDISSLNEDTQETEPAATERPIWMNNFVGPDPSCTEESSDDTNDIDINTAHIIQGVELAGAPLGFGDVDLEIYVAAQDDEDLGELPEVEMAIDGDAWDYWCGNGERGGVDVEIDDLELCYTGELVGEGEEEEEEEEDDDKEEEMEDQDGDEEEAEDAREEEKEEESVYESCPEEVMIQETEYGYKW